MGNARTYIVAWLAARSVGGSVALRIEDIDSPRVKSGAVDLIRADLDWLGLDWDGEPVVQTRRTALYEHALHRLQQREQVYPCTCSRSDVAQAASAPHGGQEGPPYPGTCSHRTVADAAHLGDRPFAWRFRAKSSPGFLDGFRGATQVNPSQLGGDFVVWKGSGTPAYQLAVVVDDADMGITEVVRGDDLVPSTPRQLLLYEALQLAAPKFVHVPLVVGPDGRRLAKRHGDTRLSALRDAGVRAESLIGLLAWSCGWLPKPEPVRIRDLLPVFRLNTIPPAPFVLTPERLHHIGYAG